MAQRRCDDWISAWLEYTRNSESPRSYHTWGAISTLAGVLQRKCYMRWGHTTIFPNQYIVLIGPSGKVRKSDALQISQRMLEQTTVTLIAESITREALIRRMKNAVSNFQEGRRFRFQSALTIVNEELAVFLGERNVQFLANLTNWYDSRDKWTYETKHGGIDEVLGVCLNLFGAMAEDWIPSTIPPGAIGGGFTSRIIFVVEDKKASIIPDPNRIHPENLLEEAMVADLQRIHQITGEFKFSDPALKRYVAWYQDEEFKTQSGRPPIKDPRFSGYVARRATHVKKIAIAMSVSHSDRRVIEEEDLKRAIALMEETEKAMPAVFGRVGLATYVEQMKLVSDYIKSHKRCYKSEVMRVFYQDVDAKALEAIESTLSAMKLVRLDRDTEKADTLYHWLGD